MWTNETNPNPHFYLTQNHPMNIIAQVQRPSVDEGHIKRQEVGDGFTPSLITTNLSLVSIKAFRLETRPKKMVDHWHVKFNDL